MESEKTESDFMMFVWFLVGNSDFSISYLKITQQWIVSYWTRINRRRVRSSCMEVFCRKVTFRNFAKFTGNRLCQSLFFNKVACLRPATLLKRLWHWCFTVNFAKFLRIPLFTEHLWWLFLKSPILKQKINTYKLLMNCTFFPHTVFKPQDSNRAQQICHMTLQFFCLCIDF